MKEITYTAPKTLCVTEAPSLPLAPDHVRIATMYSGISHGTEMNIYRGDAPQWTKVKDDRSNLFIDPPAGQHAWTYPVSSGDPGVWYMGYAAVGRISEVGSNVHTLQVGDLVYAQAPHMSEITAWEGSCVKLPEGVDPRTGIFLNNLNTAFNGILDSRIKLGDWVVVSGLGVLGQMISMLATVIRSLISPVAERNASDTEIRLLPEYGMFRSSQSCASASFSTRMLASEK